MHQNVHYFLQSLILSTFLTPCFLLLKFDSVWINCSSYGRRHSIILVLDNGVFLGLGEQAANLLMAHLPNDWCLHGTSPEECLSQHSFFGLNNICNTDSDISNNIACRYEMLDYNFELTLKLYFKNQKLFFQIIFFSQIYFLLLSTLSTIAHLISLTQCSSSAVPLITPL